MRLAIPLLMVLAFSGCRTHLVLRDRTLETAATLADLNSQHVLDNIARFETNPATLPSIAVVNSGNVLVSDQDSVGGSGTYAPTITAADQLGGFPIFNLFISPNHTHNLTENWSMVPVTDINKIRRLRCAFQLQVGGAQFTDCGNCLKLLEDYLPEDPGKLSCAIPQGWYCVGCKKDVPKNACYVGNYGQTYVWVMPEGVDGLSRFTMTIMLLATSEADDAPSKTIVMRYNAKGDFDGMEVTTEVPGDDADDPSTFSEKGTHVNPPRTSIRPKILRPGGITPRPPSLTPKQARKRPGHVQ